MPLMIDVNSVNSTTTILLSSYFENDDPIHGSMTPINAGLLNNLIMNSNV